MGQIVGQQVGVFLQVSVYYTEEDAVIRLRSGPNRRRFEQKQNPLRRVRVRIVLSTNLVDEFMTKGEIAECSSRPRARVAVAHNFADFSEQSSSDQNLLGHRSDTSNRDRFPRSTLPVRANRIRRDWCLLKRTCPVVPSKACRVLPELAWLRIASVGSAAYRVAAWWSSPSLLPLPSSVLHFKGFTLYSIAGRPDRIWVVTPNGEMRCARFSSENPKSFPSRDKIPCRVRKSNTPLALPQQPHAPQPAGPLDRHAQHRTCPFFETNLGGFSSSHSWRRVRRFAL
jgi:hypothetical protein